MASSPITPWQIGGEKVKTMTVLFSWSQKLMWMETAAMKFKDACSLEGKLWQTRQHIKKQRHHFVNKGLSSQSYGFPSSHVQVWELDLKESWKPKNWCFWIVLLEKTFKSPLDCRDIKPVNPKGNQPWIFIERTDAEAEAPILWPLYVKSSHSRKDPDAGKDWGQEEKGMAEVGMVGWHHWISGHEFKWTPQDIGGQRSLVCFSPWCHRIRYKLNTEQQQEQNT